MRKGVFRTMAVVNIRNNRRFYAPFLLTVILSAAMFYTMCSVSRNPVFTERPAVKDTLAYGVYILGFFCVIFLFYTNSFLMKRRKRELGLYHILGLEKRHIRKVMRWEGVMLATLGIGGGLLLGLLIDRLMFLILLKTMHASPDTAYGIGIYAVKTTALVFAAIFASIYISNCIAIQKASAVELLQSEHHGEREPKTRWLLAALGLLSTGAGYYIAVTTSNVAAALMNLFVAVLLVMAGTYCLFLAGSIAVLKFLRKRKGYYYKTNHFAAVSGLLYRMKKNAVGLANICILSTGVLLVLSTTVCLYAGMRDIIMTRFPSQIAVNYYDSTQEQNDALQEMVRQAAKETGTGITDLRANQSLSLTFAYVDGELRLFDEMKGAVQIDDTAAVTLLTAEDYEQNGGEALTLADDEVAVCQAKGSVGESLTFFGETYTVAKKLDKFPVSSPYAHFAGNWLNVVVSSREVLEHIDQLQKEAFSLPSDLYYETQIDVAGGEEQTMRFYYALEEKMDSAQGLPRYDLQSRYLFIDEAYGLYGSFLFLGVFLGLLFLMATVLIIYYKQVIEGYEDRERYVIMRKVGIDKREVRRCVKSQIVILFFLPLGTALVHCAVAFPLMRQILQAFYMNNVRLFAGVTCIVAAVFAVVYAGVYAVTARTYYHIVD